MDEQAGYKKLLVWQKADHLVFASYEITHSFPKDEQFSLTSQIRRAALSVPTNIVEGYARNSRNEFRRFVVISLGSLAELKYLFSVAYRLKYFKESQNNEIRGQTEQLGQLLWKFYKSFG